MAIRRYLWPKSLFGKIVAALGFVVLLYGFAHWKTSRSLAAAWALSDEVGLSNDVEVLRGPNVPDERNMAHVIDRAGKIATKFLDDEMESRGDVYDERDLYHLPDRLAAVEPLLHECEYETQLRLAMTTSEYYRPHNPRQAYEIAIGAHIQHRRSFARLESAVVARLEQHGRIHDAMERLLRFHALSRRCLHGEPSLLELLSNDAVLSTASDDIHRMLRRYRFGPAIYDRIERELAQTDNYKQLFTIAAQLAKFETVEIYTSFLAEKGLAFITPLVNVESESIVRFERRRLLTFQRPYSEARRELEQMDREVERMEDEAKLGIGLRALQFLGSHSVLMRNGFERRVVNSRCLRIFNAMAKTGDFNPDLDSLGLPEECLTDPFDGQRLRIKRDPDGPIIYSVGENLADDGGDVYRWGKRLDVGRGPIRPEPESP